MAPQSTLTTSSYAGAIDEGSGYVATASMKSRRSPKACHNPRCLGYFADAFGLEVVNVAESPRGLSPEDIAEIAAVLEGQECPPSSPSRRHEI
jgi:hypothetical protein